MKRRVVRLTIAALGLVVSYLDWSIRWRPSPPVLPSACREAPCWGLYSPRGLLRERYHADAARTVCRSVGVFALNRRESCGRARTPPAPKDFGLHFAFRRTLSIAELLRLPIRAAMAIQPEVSIFAWS